MTNYERITTAGLYALTDLGVRMIGLLNPSTCEGCPVYDECRKQDDDEYTSCIDTVRKWLKTPYNGYPTALDAIRNSSPKQIAVFLGAIGHRIFNENNCLDCPAEHICHNSIAESCEEAFRLWLEAEAEEEDSAEEPEPEPEPENEQIDISKFHSIDSSLIYLCAKCNDRLEDVICEIIDRYEHGCGCLYCGKSAVPDRSPDNEICTPADCARGLAEYLRRMED